MITQFFGQKSLIFPKKDAGSQGENERKTPICWMK